MPANFSGAAARRTDSRTSTMRDRFSRRADPESLKRTLRQTFGIRQLRAGQEQVIANVLQGHDTLAIMPTGAGKSLCYQLPALHFAGTTVVVSPLISLMKDQTDKLDEAGVEAAQMNSALGQRGQANTVDAGAEGRARHRVHHARATHPPRVPRRVAPQPDLRCS
jgi:superfamily II DNA helicase RecQ